MPVPGGVLDYNTTSGPFHNSFIRFVEEKIQSESANIWVRLTQAFNRLSLVRTGLSHLRIGRLSKIIVDHVRRNVDHEKPATDNSLVEDLMAMGTGEDVIIERLMEFFVHVVFKMGHEVAMAIWLLQTHPVEWRRLRRAVKEAGNPTNWKDIVNIPYLQWVMNESMYSFRHNNQN